MWWLEFWKVIGGIISCSADTEWETRCYCREEGKRKLLKFIGWKKRNQLQNILHSINCSKDRKGQAAHLARCLAVNGTGGTTLYEKNRGLKLQNGKSIHTIWDGFPASLSTYIYICVCVSPDSMCGLVFAAQASPSTVATDPFLLSNLSANATPRCSSSLGCSDLWWRRLRDHVPCRQRACLQPNLSWGWDWCRPGIRRVQYRRVLSTESHQDVLRQDCKLPKLFNHGLIRTIVSQETRLLRIYLPDMQPPKRHSLSLCLLMALRFLRYTQITHAYTRRIQKPVFFPPSFPTGFPLYRPLTLSSKHALFYSSKFLVQSYGNARFNLHRNPTQPASPSFPGTQYFNTGREAGCIYTSVSHTPQLCTWNCSHSSMAVNPHTCSHLRPAPLDRHLLACLCFIHQLMRDWHKLREQAV